MIKERMLEFLILDTLLRNAPWSALRQKYDLEMIKNRFEELYQEFLEPYIIDKNSKEL
jgi:hypothetical protein